MLHPDTELRLVNPTVGWGVFAQRPIPLGTITWVRDPLDQSLARQQANCLPDILQSALRRFAFLDDRDDIILCWDLARYINHSCEPTCLTTHWGAEVAIRNIAAGEELTDDYGLLRLQSPFPCACGRPACRKVILPDDPSRLGDHWRQLTRRAEEAIRQVPQPLRELLPADRWV